MVLVFAFAFAFVVLVVVVSASRSASASEAGVWCAWGGGVSNEFEKVQFFLCDDDNEKKPGKKL